MSENGSRRRGWVESVGGVVEDAKGTRRGGEVVEGGGRESKEGEIIHTSHITLTHDTSKRETQKRILKSVIKTIRQ